MADTSEETQLSGPSVLNTITIGGTQPGTPEYDLGKVVLALELIVQYKDQVSSSPVSHSLPSMIEYRESSYRKEADIVREDLRTLGITLPDSWGLSPAGDVVATVSAARRCVAAFVSRYQETSITNYNPVKNGSHLQLFDKARRNCLSLLDEADYTDCELFGVSDNVKAVRGEP
ncbi:hypothetical protein M231_07473 [Tremella mesenterica]|uniref:Uncharacterized protein n=1 Tax=Tremella mesenterica TaxID=5217 RepID=A0A4Q1BE46_TREME|nr:hypothetical protein M231_07473 [Tremella mesenterica]